MNFAGTEPGRAAGSRAGACCIVGYGNTHRRDDGLGPSVVGWLEEVLGEREGLCLLARRQLDPDLIEDLSEAKRIVLVDASVGRLEEGRRWERVAPSEGGAPHLTHSFTPGFLLALLSLLYNRQPEIWLVSIQGEDFDFGEGLSLEAEKRARQVVAELAAFVAKED